MTTRFATRINNVEIALGRLDSDWRKTAIVVKVCSSKKPGLKATNEIDPGQFGNAQAVLQAVGIAAGACAEHLGQKYKENIDPHQCVKDAMNALVEQLRLSKELTATAGMKLVRLSYHSANLNNQEQELVKRCQWMVDHGQDLTPIETMALDEVLARVHAGQL